MFRWLIRVVLLRFLPRRLLPIVTAIGIIRMLRGLRRQEYAVNEPTRSRTSPPARTRGIARRP